MINIAPHRPSYETDSQKAKIAQKDKTNRPIKYNYNFIYFSEEKHKTEQSEYIFILHK